jgi:hypothetical protein
MSGKDREQRSALRVVSLVDDRVESIRARQHVRDGRRSLSPSAKLG